MSVIENNSDKCDNLIQNQIYYNTFNYYYYICIYEKLVIFKDSNQELIIIRNLNEKTYDDKYPFSKDNNDLILIASENSIIQFDIQNSKYLYINIYFFFKKILIIIFLLKN